MLKQYLLLIAPAIIIGVLGVSLVIFGRTALSRSLVFAILISIFVGWVNVHWGKDLVAQFNTRNYSSTIGQIIQSELTHHLQIGPSAIYTHTVYDIAISYRYSVNGQTFLGTRARLIDDRGSSIGWAQRVAMAHPIGSQTPVFYNPRNPQDSLLSVGLNQTDDALTFIILAGADSFALYFWFLAWQHWKKPSEQSEAD